MKIATQTLLVSLFIALAGHTNIANATKQGLNMIDVDSLRTQYDGSGIAIAILDSGIDSTHPSLGASSICDEKNFRNDKVAGGYDFGENDGNPCHNGWHGTAVAGIVAGDIPNQTDGSNGDYIGGVAPGAKLYSLKISKANGRAGSNALLAALGWVNQHWNDDPQNPILIVNNSNTWVDNPVNEICDSTDSKFALKMFHTLEALAKRGITVFNSSGNTGYKNGIKWPGCLTKIHAIGAVFDTSGKVQGVSNTGDLVDLFAPGGRAITTDINQGYRKFGTTSAATAYASGSAAVIQHAAKKIIGRYLLPDELIKLLTDSGDDIVDDKSPTKLHRPLINIDRAITMLHKL